MENINLDSIFETSDFSSMGHPCLSAEDRVVTENINAKMKQAFRAYSSMVQRSHQLCVELRLA